MRPWQDLLHLERLPGATSDDGLGPLVDGLTLLAPVLLLRVPYALVFEGERDEPQRSHVESRRLDLSRKVGMPGVAPLLARPNDDDLGGDHLPEPACTEREDAAASEKSAARRVLFDRQRDQLDRAAQVDVVRGGLVLASAPRRGRALCRERIEAEPLAVGGKVPTTRRMRGQHDIGCRHDMLGAVRTPAPCRQPAPWVPVVVK